MEDIMKENELVEIIKSWDAKRIVPLARENEEILILLSNFLEDEKLRLRALIVIEEILSSKVSRRASRELLPKLLPLLKDEERIAVRAAKIIKLIFRAIPPTRGDVINLLKTVTEIEAGCRDLRWLELSEIADSLPLANYDGAEKYVESLLKKNNPGAKLVGLKFARVLSGIGEKSIVEGLLAILREGNPLILNAALDFIIDVVTSPVFTRSERENIAKRLLPAVKNLTEVNEDPMLKSKADVVYLLLMKTVGQHHPGNQKDVPKLLEICGKGISSINQSLPKFRWKPGL